MRSRPLQAAACLFTREKTNNKKTKNTTPRQERGPLIYPARHEQRRHTVKTVNHADIYLNIDIYSSSFSALYCSIGAISSTDQVGIDNFLVPDKETQRKSGRRSLLDVVRPLPGDANHRLVSVSPRSARIPRLMGAALFDKGPLVRENDAAIINQARRFRCTIASNGTLRCP